MKIPSINKTQIKGNHMLQILSFGAYLKAPRKHRGLSQTDVQNFLGLSSSGVVSHWEKDKSYMSNENARALSRLYELDEDEIMFRLFRAKSYEPTIRKWLQQYKGVQSVTRFLHNCDNGQQILSKMESLH